MFQYKLHYRNNSYIMKIIVIKPLMEFEKAIRRKEDVSVTGQTSKIYNTTNHKRKTSIVKKLQIGAIQRSYLYNVNL